MQQRDRNRTSNSQPVGGEGPGIYSGDGKALRFFDDWGLKPEFCCQHAQPLTFALVPGKYEW